MACFANERCRAMWAANGFQAQSVCSKCGTRQSADRLVCINCDQVFIHEQKHLRKEKLKRKREIEDEVRCS